MLLPNHARIFVELLVEARTLWQLSSTDVDVAVEAVKNSGVSKDIGVMSMLLPIIPYEARKKFLADQLNCTNACADVVAKSPG